MRCSSPAGPASSAPTSSKRLAAAGDEVVVLDKLTYAGNPANLEGVDVELRRRRHRDADAVAEAGAGCDAVVNFAAETHVDRSILGAGGVHRDRRPRHVRAARAGRATPASRLVQVSTDEVYGDIPRAQRSARGRPAAPVEPVRGVEGRRRPAGARGYVRTLRRRRVHHARLEHLRAEPVPGEADPALRHERARRRAAAGLRRRPPAARLAPRRGPLRRDRARPPRGARRARSTTSAARSARTSRSTRRILELTGRERGADPPRRRPARPRPPLLARRLEAPRARLVAGALVRRDGPRRHGRRGTATTAPGGSRSRAASTGATTSSSTAPRLALNPCKPARRSASLRCRLCPPPMPSRRLVLVAVLAAALLGPRRGQPAVAKPTAVDATTFVITGHGWGHGVGMAQWGAYGYAKHGVTLRQDPRPLLPGHHARARAGDEDQRPPGRGREAGGRLVARPVQVEDADGRVVQAGAPASTPVDPTLVGRGATRPSPAETLPGPAAPSLPGQEPALARRNPYRGSFTVSSDGKNLTVVNTVGLEAYIRGVVSSEMPHDWPLEAVKAQAVAARSYALAHRRGGTFDVYNDTRDQVYGGIAAETPVGDTGGRGTERPGAALRRQGREHVLLLELGRADGRPSPTSSPARSRRRTWSRSATPGTPTRRTTTGAPVVVAGASAAKLLGIAGADALQPVPATGHAKSVVVTGRSGDVTVPAVGRPARARAALDVDERRRAVAARARSASSRRSASVTITRQGDQGAEAGSRAAARRGRRVAGRAEPVDAVRRHLLGRGRSDGDDAVPALVRDDQERRPAGGRSRPHEAGSRSRSPRSRWRCPRRRRGSATFVAERPARGPAVVPERDPRVRLLARGSGRRPRAGAGRHHRLGHRSRPPRVRRPDRERAELRRRRRHATGRATARSSRASSPPRRTTARGSPASPFRPSC